jgi:ATP-dependent DNA helicase RecG
VSENVRFHRLGLIVIDEQHRFGVEQRAALRQAAMREPVQSAAESSMFERRLTSKDERAPRAPIHPHILVMTATPIPRTLAMTLFGDLDISTIRESPPGRSPIITRVVTMSERTQVYEYVAKRLHAGEQAYIVLPAIDETSTTELRHVREQADWLSNGPFKGLRIAQIHGRLKRETRARIMERFRQNKIHALVATTVIEVGVDVPGATVMVVEHAERYGLSQLHQLRGRVGRGSKKSLCVYIGDPTTDDARARLDAVRQNSDGFEIAERDFDIRGMGEIFGTKQSGGAPFRWSQFPDDMALLQAARRDAVQLVREDPALDRTPETQLLYRRLVRKYGEFFGFVDVA